MCREMEVRLVIGFVKTCSSKSIDPRHDRLFILLFAVWEYHIGCHGYDQFTFNIKVDMTPLKDFTLKIEWLYLWHTTWYPNADLCSPVIFHAVSIYLFILFYWLLYFNSFYIILFYFIQTIFYLYTYIFFFLPCLWLYINNDQSSSPKYNFVCLIHVRNAIFVVDNVTMTPAQADRNIPRSQITNKFK